jgi:hypothetical protein
MPDVETQVEFRKITIAGPGYAEHAGVDKVKSDQADKRLAVAQI